MCQEVLCIIRIVIGTPDAIYSGSSNFCPCIFQAKYFNPEAHGQGPLICSDIVTCIMALYFQSLLARMEAETVRIAQTKLAYLASASSDAIPHRVRPGCGTQSEGVGACLIGTI